MNERPKIYLTELTIGLLREHALSTGRTEEWFDNWLKSYVEILEEM